MVNQCTESSTCVENKNCASPIYGLVNLNFFVENVIINAPKDTISPELLVHAEFSLSSAKINTYYKHRETEIPTMKCAGMLCRSAGQSSHA